MTGASVCARVVCRRTSACAVLLQVFAGLVATRWNNIAACRLCARALVQPPAAAPASLIPCATHNPPQVRLFRRHRLGLHALRNRRLGRPHRAARAVVLAARSPLGVPAPSGLPLRPLRPARGVCDRERRERAGGGGHGGGGRGRGRLPDPVLPRLPRLTLRRGGRGCAAPGARARGVGVPELWQQSAPRPRTRASGGAAGALLLRGEAFACPAARPPTRRQQARARARRKTLMSRTPTRCVDRRSERDALFCVEFHGQF